MPPVGNIGPRGARDRQSLGFLLLAAGTVMVLTCPQGEPAWWQLLLYFVFFNGCLSVLQAREKT
ncbi:MAG: hypothetical protein HY319_29140 [Armatimonadetes bacterium]|nr:hypothetical protein [Armatimonadota bacterium]